MERVISWYYYVRAPWYFVERKRAFPDLPLPNPNWLRKVSQCTHCLSAFKYVSLSCVALLFNIETHSTTSPPPPPHNITFPDSAVPSFLTISLISSFHSVSLYSTKWQIEFYLCLSNLNHCELPKIINSSTSTTLSDYLKFTLCDHCLIGLVLSVFCSKFSFCLRVTLNGKDPSKIVQLRLPTTTTYAGRQTKNCIQKVMFFRMLLYL